VPCYTERRIGVDLNVANEDVLTRALTAAGYTNIRKLANGSLTFATPSGAYATIVNGEVVMSGSHIERRTVENLAAQIKVAYAKEAVATAAKKGWSMTTSKKTGQMTLTRKRW
jgi:hypothetical protein